MRDWDVWTLGETMIRLTPKGVGRLEEAAELEMRIGGSESNLAVALTRLGLRAAWASRLPEGPLGEMVLRRIRGFGVDVSCVRRTSGERMGLYFIEPGAPPRSSVVLYDRAGSAASRMTPECFDWSALERARHLHLTGITPALGEGPRATALRAMAEARARGLTRSFDLNYRARLWPADVARETLKEVGQGVDLLILTADDALALFGLDGDAEGAAVLAEWFGAGRVALTLGGEGALLWDRGEVYRAEAYPVQAIDRVGAGDAFAAGLIAGFLSEDVAGGLRRGMAMAALKHTIPGDEFVSSPAEVDQLVESGHRDIRR